ncbi:hypothetical protein EX30DRAFT_375435 [Ascodesmis nigricans]|uniref:Uncharacterized protein n=1 Tax=Ascodesmis nigricans TaxID=341454 RepID=A0A4S2MI21_9PEZI|nr:hypothetical protein EX30DRAFT_375435 [Ascodesmis nigricans]
MHSRLHPLLPVLLLITFFIIAAHAHPFNPFDDIGAGIKKDWDDLKAEVREEWEETKQDVREFGEKLPDVDVDVNVNWNH